MLFKGRDHACGHCFHRIDAVTTGDDVLFLGVDETDHLIVPGGFFEFLENPGVPALNVVDDRDGFKVGLDQFDQSGVREDFGPKDLAATSSGDFLKEEKDGLA